MTKPLISICMPTYNGEPFLEEAIHSALTQTLGDFELLIVDDCSTDNTVAIAQRHALADPRVRVIQNEQNMGLVGNWNKCIGLTNGEWIKFLFQDDILDPTCLEKMIAVSQNARWVLVNRTYFFDESVSPKDKKEYLSLENEVTFSAIFKGKQHISAAAFSMAVATYPAINIFGEPTCVMIKKEVFEELGEFDASFRQICDYEYWVRIGVNYGMVAINEKLVKFRVHGKSTSMSNHSEKAFYVLYYDFFAFIHKLTTSPLFAPFLWHTENQRQIIDVEAAKHVQNLRKWCHDQSRSQEATLVEAFPSMKRYFKDTNRLFYTSLFLCAVYHPRYFLVRLKGKIKSEYTKLVS
jgi:glycosyltransferase involved in cell wall biosynthesis